MPKLTDVRGTPTLGSRNSAIEDRRPATWVPLGDWLARLFVATLFALGLAFPKL